MTEASRKRWARWRRWARCAVEWLSVAAVVPRRASPGDAAAPVLVVRLDAIGDFVLWLPQAAGLRALWPGRPLVLVANALWAPLARQLHDWDEVLDIDLGRWEANAGYRMERLRCLRRRRFAVALEPTPTRRAFVGDQIVRCSGAALRIGHADRGQPMSRLYRWLADSAYTWRIEAGPAGGTAAVPASAHESVLGQRLMAALRDGLDTHPAAAQDQPGWTLPAVAVLPAALLPAAPYAVVVPGAGWSGRCWPVERFAQALASPEFGHLQWLLCGSPGERGRCDALLAQLAALGVPALNLAGHTSLPQLCELVRRATVLVANETSAVHIAAAVGTPSVCLLGGGHFGRFVPYPAGHAHAPLAVYHAMPCYGCNWDCHLPHAQGEAVPCISAIDVDALRAALRAVLAGERGAARSGPTTRCAAPLSD